MSDKPNVPPPPIQPSTSLVNDPQGDGTVGWDSMPAAARAAACLAVLASSWSVDTDGMRWNPGTRIAFASRPSPWTTPADAAANRERRQVVQIYVDGDEVKFMDRIRAGHGQLRHDEVQRLVHPQRRWFPGRRK